MDLNNRVLTLNMDVSEIYEIFLHEISKKASKENNEIKKKVIEGVAFKFNIEDFIKGRFSQKCFIKLKSGREVGEDILKIIINGKTYLMRDFDDEIIVRVRLMRSWLWENTQFEKVGTARGLEDGER